MLSPLNRCSSVTSPLFHGRRWISRKPPPPGKPPILPPAKKLLYNVVHVPWMRAEDVKELLWRRHVYNNAMVSLRKLFAAEASTSNFNERINPVKIVENEEFDKLLLENEERNRVAAERRREKSALELGKMEKEYLKTIEDELSRREENVKRRKTEVLAMVDKSKSFVTEENLDERLEEALENPVVYDFAVDLQGNKYFAPKPEKYPKGTPTRQKGRMYDATLGANEDGFEPFRKSSSSISKERKITT